MTVFLWQRLPLEKDGVFWLDVEGRSEKKEWLLALTEIYIDIVRAERVPNERTIFLINIPSNVSVLDFLVACQIKFKLNESKMYYRGHEIERDVSLDCAESPKTIRLPHLNI